MKTLIASVLAVATLFATVVPVMAFDTENFANHAVAWQKKNQRIANNMNNSPSSVRNATSKLIDAADPYIDFLERIAPVANTCQTNAGFSNHRFHVLKYGINLIDAWQAMVRDRPGAALRLIRAAKRHYNVADDIGERIINRCW